MLQVDLRELAHGPVETSGELAGDDPLFAGLDVMMTEPVRVGGRLQAAGEGSFYWQGTLRTVVAAQCRRCLASLVLPVRAQIGALFSRDTSPEDDPDVYPLVRDAMVIDVRPVVREELILAVPQYALCREDCRGLCPRCGQDLNAGPCGCPRSTDPRWAGLAAVKGKPRPS